MTYQKHLDGIRGLAILLVLLYHINENFLSGGFIGVDVFFVLSGYLITSGILYDLKAGKFSIKEFYRKRIKRILPAYFSYVSVILLLGSCLFYTKKLAELGISALSSALFVPNIYFYKITGNYFDSNVDQDPLKNLWSLGVEEQFYIFIPIICLIIWKYKRNWIFPVMLALFLASLAGSIYLVLNQQSTSAFYQVQWRAWELLAGSICAIVTLRANLCDTFLVHSRVWSCISSLSLLTIFCCAILMGKQSDFPGHGALLIVLSTCILVLAPGIVKPILENTQLRWFGKISYSLYLWHWGVIIFWKYCRWSDYYGDEVLIWFDYLGMLAISLLLAWLSWKYIESPFRYRDYSYKQAFTFSTIGVLFISLVSASCTYTDGWQKLRLIFNNNIVSRDNNYTTTMDVKIQAIYRRLLEYIKSGSYEVSIERLGDDDYSSIPEYIILGDSHAHKLNYGFDRCGKIYGNYGFLVYRWKTPGTNTYSLDCEEYKEMVVDLISKYPSINKLILHNAWTADSAHYNWQMQLEEFCNEHRAKGLQIYLIADVPRLDKNNNNFNAGSSCLWEKNVILNGSIPKEDLMNNYIDYLNMNLETNNKLKKVAIKTSSIYLNPERFLRDGENYLLVCNKSNTYRDNNHLDAQGSFMLAHGLWRHIFESK